MLRLTVYNTLSPIMLSAIIFLPTDFSEEIYAYFVESFGNILEGLLVKVKQL